MNDTERFNHDRASVMSMIKFILMIGIIGALCWLGTKIFVILVPFLIGFLLAKTSNIIASPIAGLFTKSDPSKIRPGQKKSTRTKVASCVYAILIILLLIIVVFICIALIAQANNLIEKIAGLAGGFDFSSISIWLDSLAQRSNGIIKPEMTETFKDSLNDMGNNIVSAIPSVLTRFLSSVWNLIGNIPYGVFFVISIILSGHYFINDGPGVLRFYVRNTPNRLFRNRVFSLVNDPSVTLFQVLGGYLILMVITSVEAALVFALSGMSDYAVVLGIVTGVIDFLPVVGASIVMIPAAIFLVFHNQLAGALVIVGGLAIMTVIRRVIEPPIIGKSMHVHPLITLISMGAGVYIWGAAGFLLGPMLAIIIIQVFKVFELNKKVMSYLSSILERLMRKSTNDSDDSKDSSITCDPQS